MKINQHGHAVDQTNNNSQKQDKPMPNTEAEMKQRWNYNCVFLEMVLYTLRFQRSSDLNYISHGFIYAPFLISIPPPLSFKMSNYSVSTF